MRMNDSVLYWSCVVSSVTWDGRLVKGVARSDCVIRSHSHTRFGQGEPRLRERRRFRGRMRCHRSGREGWPIVGTDRLAAPWNTRHKVSNRFGGSTTFESRALPRPKVDDTSGCHVREGFEDQGKSEKEGSRRLVVLDPRAVPENIFISGRPRIIPAYSTYSGTGRGTTL